MTGLALIAAACSIAVTGIGAGLAIGKATAKAVESTARQPEAAGKIQTILLLGAALAEATAIYGLVVSLMILSKI